MLKKSVHQPALSSGLWDKPSLNKRVLRLVAVAFLLLAGYFLTSDYYTTIDHAEKLTLQKLQGIVNDLSGRIDGHLHQQLTHKHPEFDGISHFKQDPNYSLIHNILANAHRAHNLETPIYTFVKSGSKSNELAFIVTSSIDPYYRHTYTSFPECAFQLLDQGGTIPLYKDEYGHWLSAFAPIRDHDENIIAYVQADEHFDNFIAEVRGTLICNTLISLFGFGLVMLFLFPYLNRMLQEEERNQAILKKSLEETRVLTKKLEENEEELTQKAYQLQQSNKDLTDFAHIASHDLKAPVRNIYSFAQLIQRHNRDRLDDSTKEYLDFIIKSSKRAQMLISGLLSYSTADKDLGKQEETPMSNIVEMAKHNLTSIIKERNAEVLFGELFPVKVNSILIAQVLQNLINNGIKYNQSDRPVITIGTGNSPQDGLYFFVKDNGIGIPEKYQADVFQMFKRLHANQDYEGSGIGLAFCNRVVHAYGGKMWLSSSEEKGSTFYFTLPAAMIKEERVKELA